MIYLILGGTRSGKSSYAEELALTFSKRPIYIATSREWDANYADRIARHKKDRAEKGWTTIEVEKKINHHELKNRVVVVDCITMWLVNFFSDLNYNSELSFTTACKEFDTFCDNPATLILVSNEIGMGVHPATVGGRDFSDLQGWMNQYIAKKADKVILMTAGIPRVIKDV